MQIAPFIVTLGTTIACSTTTLGQGDVSSNWFRNPAISPDGGTIAFVHAGDIYLVDAAGGRARPLTIHEAFDSNPVWSADGSMIAFSSNRFGNDDVFVVPADGGTATRLTFHSADDTPADFTPDGGHVYFTSQRVDHADSALFPTGAFNELYHVPLTGGTPTMVLTTANVNPEVSPDGTRFLYEDRKGYEDPLRKHHTSSVARDVWLRDTRDGTHVKLTDFAGEDRDPSWHGRDAMVFLSERSGDFNVWKQRLRPGAVPEQLTDFDHHPVRHLTRADNGTLAFSWHGDLYTVRDGRGTARKRRRHDRRGRPRQRAGAHDDARRRDAVLRRPKRQGGRVRRAWRGLRHLDRLRRPRDRSPRPPSRSGTSTSAPTGARSSTRPNATARGTSTSPSSTSASSTSSAPPSSTSARSSRPTPTSSSPAGRPMARRWPTCADARNSASSMSRAATRSSPWTPPTGTPTPMVTCGSAGPRRPTGSRCTSTTANRIFVGEAGLVKADGSGETHRHIEIRLRRQFAPRFAMDGGAFIWASDRYGERPHGSWGAEYDVLGTFLTQDAFDRFRLTKEEYELPQGDEEEGSRRPQEEEASRRREADESSEDVDASTKDDDARRRRRDDQRSRATPTVTPRRKDDAEDEAPEPLEIETDGLDTRTVRLTTHASALGDFAMAPDGKALYYLASFEGDLRPVEAGLPGAIDHARREARRAKTLRCRCQTTARPSSSSQVERAVENRDRVRQAHADQVRGRDGRRPSRRAGPQLRTRLAPDPPQVLPPRHARRGLGVLPRPVRAEARRRAHQRGLRRRSSQSCSAS